MKKYQAIVIALVLLVSFVMPAVAVGPAKVLSKSVLDKFLKDFPAIQADLDALGQEFSDQFNEFNDDGSGTVNFSAIRQAMTAAMSDSRVKAIFTKYGWSNSFIEVYTTVLTGFSYMMFEELDAMYPMDQYKEYMNQVKASVNADDLALIKANRAEIEEVLSSIE